MKTLKELRENLDAKGVGLEKGIMPPGSVRKVRTIARQVSNASQPNIPQVINRIDEELRKYGYTIGELDMGDDFDYEGSEDFAIFAYPELQPMRNLYITVEWEKTNAMIYQYSPDVLQFTVRVLVNITDPVDFDGMVGDGLYDEGETKKDAVEESVEEDTTEDLQEMVRVKKKARLVEVESNGKVLQFHTGPTGIDIIIMKKDRSSDEIISFKKKDAEAVMSAIMDTFLDV